ncbi:hypothetical protein [Sphingomonas sp.]|uniref:hypothetical protein n=1 Tax=Sphingomonas sp. TaxID=28214 RepID=UPI0025DDA52C|nr:hypothetical protein [Sphingomonas sp.]
MKRLCSWFGVSLLAVAGAVPLPAQEAKQTAEGAQRFFAQLVQDGRVTISGNLARVPIHVTGTHVFEVGRSSFSGVGKFRNAPITFDGFGPVDFKSPDFASDKPCESRISNISYHNMFETEITRQYSNGRGYIENSQQSVPAMPKEMVINWSRVNVTGGTGLVRVSWTDPSYKNSYIDFVIGGGKELMDRVEFAAKFLQASCDVAANTGF